MPMLSEWCKLTGAYAVFDDGRFKRPDSSLGRTSGLAIGTSDEEHRKIYDSLNSDLVSRVNESDDDRIWLLLWHLVDISNDNLTSDNVKEGIIRNVTRKLYSILDSESKSSVSKDEDSIIPQIIDYETSKASSRIIDTIMGE